MLNKKYYKIALILAHITVFYNIVEGIVSVIFGYEDETLSLFGFGIDSFVEVLSGVGILNMLYRIQKNSYENTRIFEKRALKITGVAFYILSIGLVIGAVMNIYKGHKPETTLAGIIISSISIFTMLFLMNAKLYIGKKLASDAIISDAKCTKTCIYLSVILLLSSLFFEITKIGYLDSIGALGIAYYSFKEGKEAFDKAKGKCNECD